MFKYLIVFCTLIVYSPFVVMSQNVDRCITGKVSDIETGEPIPFVHVATLDLTEGTVTDNNGYFKLCIDSNDSVQIRFFHTAFQTYTTLVDPTGMVELIIKLKTKAYQTEEVTIKGNKQTMVKALVPGKIKLEQKDILLTPTLLGSPDLVRTLQLMPGIQSVNEGNSGIYVRGGSPGHNYIVFDDIELMNPSHLMGIYSVFNPLLVDVVDFYKGNAPVHLSSRLASSIVVKSRTKKDTAYNWSGNVGNISSNLVYQGQTKNKKWYFDAGLRRSYLEVLQEAARPFIKDEDNYFKNNKFNFYDFNGKIKYQGRSSSLTLAWYKGGDVFKFSDKGRAVSLNNNWGNEGASLIWRSVLSDNLSMKNAVSYSSYKSSLKVDFVDQDLKFKTDYRHVQYKNDFLYPKGRNTLRWGAYVTHKYVSPQDVDISLNSNNSSAFNSYKHLSVKLPASNRFVANDKLSLYLGGAIEYYKLLQKDQKGQSGSTKKDESDFLWNAVAIADYKLSSDRSVKSSYSYVSQIIHLTSVASIPLPSDIWMPATDKVPAEIGHQFTLGYFKEVEKWDLEFGVEAYGKYTDNTLMLKVNVEQEEVGDFEDSFFKGKAKAWGTEFSLKKNGSDYQAQLSYTLGFVRQKFDDINQGAWHDAKYDRRHDLNVLASYRVNERMELGSSFVFATGNKATLPKGRYWMMGDIANDYEGVNNYRMPVYHRWDLSLNYHLKSKRFHESILNFSLINVLNRSNPYFVYYHIDEGNMTYELTIKARQVSLFPIMPSLSWRFKF